MRDAQPRTIRLKDYRVPDFLIDTTELHFDLHEDKTRVRSKLAIRRNPAAENQLTPLRLDGQDLLLIGITIDGKTLAASDYIVESEQLTVVKVPNQFSFECETEIKPQLNTSLEGLYKSRTMFCTQCEAEGFRKITYFLDRPDVMSVFTVRIEAAKDYPVLLSNGNLIESGELANDRHFAVWSDPFKKPCYLFALVVGDLAHIEDRFTTMSGRDVALRIYVEPKDADKCDHAMLSLKHSMRWDEEVYGREYDLDIFNIVAVDDFNMGAMENKSLNIFNTSCVLAQAETTTDIGFQRVEGVVAHEYFHNWSGNRVTCRDWFQLSLKEGFTVFRDAEFSADMGSRTVKRVEDVSLLRTMQFAEDAGPMAHPVRPDSYMEISNFYTLTVYEKGAEVVRMLHVLLGPELFRKGTDLYFERHDGQAVTCDDFVIALEDASGRDLKQFRRWYEQAGTPQLDVSGEYSADKNSYTLTVRQSTPATPGQAQKAPLHIPLAVALLGDAGALRLQLANTPANVEKNAPRSQKNSTELVLDVTEAEQRFTFVNIPERPVPSLLRGFSAPVKLHFPYSRDELMFLMSRDSDGFCRWDAGQQLAVATLNDMIDAHQRGAHVPIDTRVIEAFSDLLVNDTLDPAMVALMLTLPSEAYLAEIHRVADVAAIHAARQAARLQIARALREPLLQTYRRNINSEPYAASAQQIAQRSLKNSCLAYLMLLEESDLVALCIKQFETAANMTDTIAALVALVNSNQLQAKTTALAQFYQRWQHEALVVNQWFQVQAACILPGALEAVQQLMQHPAFDIKNPNKVRALIGTFAGQNAVNFHRADGAGYRFLADQIIVLNGLNPQIAARQLAPLSKWQKYPRAAQQCMITELHRIAAVPNLSRDVYEVVAKSLAEAQS